MHTFRPRGRYRRTSLLPMRPAIASGSSTVLTRVAVMTALVGVLMTTVTFAVEGEPAQPLETVPVYVVLAVNTPTFTFRPGPIRLWSEVRLCSLAALVGRRNERAPESEHVAPSSSLHRSTSAARTDRQAFTCEDTALDDPF